MAKWTFTPAEESSSSTEEENELSDWTFTPAPTRSEVEKPEPREITPERSVVESTGSALPEIPVPEIPQVNIDPVTPVGVAPVRPETSIQKPKTIIPKREDVVTVDPVLAPPTQPKIPQVDIAPVVPESQAFEPRVEPEAVSQIELAQAQEEIRRREAQEEKAPRVGLPVLDDDVVSDVEEIRRREAQFETLKGELELPIRGAVGTAFYYDPKNPNTPAKKFGTINKNAGEKEDFFTGAQGVFVPSKLGDSVRSVANGTVQYADFLRGYGNVVIVDHGQGFSIVYGNNESTTVKAGDQIKAGDQLGTAGNSGGMKKTGTYLEVRRDSEAIDPMEWFSSTAGAGVAAEKGIKTAIEQFKMTAPAIQLQAASNQIVDQRNLLSVFDRLDNGEQLPSIIQSLIPEREELPSGAPYGSRRLLSEELDSFGGAPGLTKEQTDINNFGRAYLEASPEEKAQMRAAANEIITNGTKFVEEMIPEINRFLKATVDLREGVPRLNEVKSAKDVAALFSYYGTQGLAQIAPLVITGAATKSRGAVVSLAGTMNLGGSVTQRFNYLMNAFKGIETTDEKAEALIEYLEKTGDDTLKQAILNTGLDSFFGVVGQATKAKYAKELGKGTVKQQAKEVSKQVGSEAVTEGTQEFIDAATAVKLRETKNALFSKKTFADVLEAAVAGGLGAGTFKAVEIPTGIGLRKTVETYKDSRVKAVLDGIFDRLTPKEKEFVNAQNEAGTSPSETLDLLQITFGQKKDPTRVLDPDGNEIADAIGSENAKDITEFVNANKKITEEVENGNYTEQEADAIADKVFSLIEQEGMTGDAAFAQAKKEADDTRDDGEQESSGLYDTQIYDEEGKPVLTQEQDKKEVEDSRLETPSDGRVPEVNNIRYEEDIPDEKWLNSKKKIDEKLGRDEYGRLKNLNSSITGQFKDVTGGNSKTAILELPVTLLQDLPGWANEHIRLQDVEQHTSSDTKTFADMRNDWDTVKRYPIDIRVDSDGNARVYEGNHRLTLAKELGQTSVPVLVTYHAVNPKKAQEGFTPEELLFTHKKYNKEKQAQAKTQTEEQDQTKEQSSLPVEYADIINDPNINSQAELFSRMAEAAVAREKQAQEQSRTQAQTQTSAQLPPPDLTEYGDAAPAIEAANLEANRIADEGFDAPLSIPENIPAPTEQEQQGYDALIQDNEKQNKDPQYDQSFLNPDPDNPSLLNRINILSDVREEATNRSLLLENLHNLNQSKWTPVLAALPTDDVRRLFHHQTENLLNFKDGVDEDHLFNIAETFRDITSEEGQRLKRYAPLIQSWSDFIKKSRVSPREAKDRVKNGKVIKGAGSRGVQLSKIMNLSRRLQVDLSKQTYEALTNPNAKDAVNTSTGEVLTDPKILKLLEEQNLAVRNKYATTSLVTSINKELADRRRDIRELYDQWEDLTDSPYGQQAADIYTGTLQAYRELFNDYESVLIDNVKSLGVKEADTAEIVADIQQRFNDIRTNEPVYFKAVRNGDYYVRIPKTLSLKGTNTKVPGTRGNIFLNSMAEVTAVKKELAKRFEIDVNNEKELRFGEVNKYIDDVLSEDSGGLVKRIYDAIDNSATIASKEGKKDLKQMIGQIWLQTLPSSNVKVLFGSRRQGTYGESNDVISGLVTTIKAAANQYPRIRNANKINNELNAARAQVANFPNQLALNKIINEIEKRVNLELTPPGGVSHAIARGLNKFTFAYLLSSPKTAVVQLTQYPLVMTPILNEYFGESVGYLTTKATALRYMNLFNTLGFGRLENLDPNNPGRVAIPSIIKSRYIQGTGPGTLHRRILVEAGAYNPNAQKEADEFIAFMKYAWSQADQAGILKQTYATDLGTPAELPSVYKQGIKAGLDRGMALTFNVMTELFSTMEMVNRELSFMSAAELAYREAGKQGLVGDARYEQALARAFEATREGALDFSSPNKPRIMKETAYGVTFTQFASYMTNMVSLIYRRFYRVLTLMNELGYATTDGKLPTPKYTFRERLAALESLIHIQTGTFLLAGLSNVVGGSYLAWLVLTGLSKLLDTLYEGDMEEKQEETTEKNRARIKALRKKQEEYDKFFASSDEFRKNRIGPPKLSKKQSDELSNLVAIEGVKQWREDMKEHPRYKGFLNFKNYMRDIAIPGYFGVGGSVSNYFNLGTDASANITSIIKDGLPAFYGADISRNTSLSNLFISDMPPDPDPSGFDMAVYAAQNLNLFPSLSVLNNLRKGATAAYKQDWRTFYKSMPRFFNPAIEQYYLSKEGAESYLGDPFEKYGPEYFTTRKKVLGAIGFADKEYSDRRKQTYLNNRFKTIVEQDRAQILQDWQEAIREISAYKTRKNRTDPKKRSTEDVLDADKLIERKYYDAIRKKDDFNALYGMLGFTTPITQDTWIQVQYNARRKSYFQFISNGILDGAEKNPAEALAKLKAFENATGDIFPKEDIDVLRNALTLEYEKDIRKRRRKANEEMQKEGTDPDISFD